MTTVESVTKIQAAERQLRVAIQLFFERADLVAVSTLTSAAGQVLRDLGRHRGIPSPIRDSDLIRDERRAEFIQILNRAPNFFKHADRDPEEILDFHPDAIPFEIFEAVIMFWQLEHRWPAEMGVFWTWTTMKYPQLVKPGAMAEAASRATDAGIDPNDFAFIREAIRHMQR